MHDTDPAITLTGDPLDRCDALRKDPVQVQKFRDHPDALYVVVCAKEILILPDGLLALVSAQILPELELDASGILFLGVDNKTSRPWFAISPKPDCPKNHQFLESLGQFADLRAALAKMEPADLAIAGRVLSLFSWHKNNRFCPGCGGKTASTAGGEKRVCATCELEYFPRVDPAVIMLVTHKDNCLLGRSANWPPGHYSTLAGFVEPGESLEEACRREVMEEAGIAIGQVDYAFSQPWPFPIRSWLHWSPKP